MWARRGSKITELAAFPGRGRGHGGGGIGDDPAHPRRGRVYAAVAVQDGFDLFPDPVGDDGLAPMDAVAGQMI